MPATYVGDASATQAPSDPPAAGNPPKALIPLDGEGATAASVTQMIKVLADFVTWLLSPFANASAWVQALVRWRNARLQTRSAIDHFGFRNGNVIEWDENWSDNLLQSITTTGNTVGERWTFHTDGSGVLGGVLTSHPPRYTTGDNMGSRLMGIGTIPSGGRADLQLNAAWWSAVFTDDITASMWWSFLLPPTATTNCTFVMGWTSDFQPANAITDGAYMHKGPSDTNWQLTTVSAAGGGSTTVDSGIAAGSGAFHTAGIVLVGANQSDDSTAHAFLFIDGVKVGDITAHLPYTAGSGLPLSPIFGTLTTAGASTIDLLFGPLRYRQSMFAGDSFI